jgi:tubulin monoglycylase TTLL15
MEPVAALRNRVRRQSRMTAVIGLILFVGLVVIGMQVYELKSLNEGRRLGVKKPGDGVAQKGDVDVKRKHKTCIYARGRSHLQHVIAVFERLGYDTLAKQDDNWDVLWSHEYPFSQLGEIIKQMKPTQKLNHWPGTGHLTMKGRLATSKLPSTPIGFRIPEEVDALRAEAKQNPDKLWVQKSNNHRGVRVKKLEEMELLNLPYDAGVFVQEFISNPFLIDGRKFDIGVYVVITSIDPLRVYSYEDEVLLRFCTLPYYPLDVIEVNQYVVNDEYTPTWKLKPLIRLYNDFYFSHKQTLSVYLKQQGHDPDKMWTAIKDSIREAIFSKEEDFKKSLAHYPSNRNFFELVRFDFALDDALKVWLLEVNMSPNLSSGHFAPNKWMYEQVVYNTLRLVGLAKTTHTLFHDVTRDEREMMVNSRDIQVAPEHCATDDCSKSCEKEICKLCQVCRPSQISDTLKDAFLEHVNRGNFRRVIPHPLVCNMII